MNTHTKHKSNKTFLAASFDTMLPVSHMERNEKSSDASQEVFITHTHIGFWEVRQQKCLRSLKKNFQAREVPSFKIILLWKYLANTQYIYTVNILGKPTSRILMEPTLFNPKNK